MTGRKVGGHTAAASTTPFAARTRWFPAEPLIQALDHERRRAPMHRIVERSGIDRRTLERVRHKRRLRMDTADRLAVAIGKHPCELWSDWYEDAS